VVKSCVECGTGFTKKPSEPRAFWATRRYCSHSCANRCTLVLHADHIKPFALHPDLRFELGNGRTLCEPCHRATNTWGRGAIYRVPQEA